MDLVEMQRLLQQQHQSVRRNIVQNGRGGAETASISDWAAGRGLADMAHHCFLIHCLIRAATFNQVLC